MKPFLKRLVVVVVLGSLGCAAEDASQVPMPFRFAAVGQEPGWLLEIDSAHTIRFSYDYAQRTVSGTGQPPASDSSGARVWHLKNDSTDLRVVVSATPCEDVMSGKPYPATVTVTLNGQVYRGCGGEVDSPSSSGARP
jgi:uncharacterized membrane protein